MTDNEIIKALECCIEETTDCNNCPLYLVGDADCFDKAKQGALNIINRQKAEIERLNRQCNRLKKYDEERDIRLHARLIANARAEAITEFEERLKQYAECMGECNVDNPLAETYSVVREEYIDRIAKELKGGGTDA